MKFKIHAARPLGESFIPVLIAVHHIRARYPDAPSATRESREPERRRGRPDADLGRRPS